MQTFLAFESFAMSAACLDAKRLGKQRVEAWQILQALRDPSYGWQSHPAVKMWRGYERALASYGLAICDEWLSRGYKDTMRAKFLDCLPPSAPTPAMPSWLGSPTFHASHRAALLYKDPKYYSRFGWTELPAVPDAKGSLPYVWPV